MEYKNKAPRPQATFAPLVLWGVDMCSTEVAVLLLCLLSAGERVVSVMRSDCVAVLFPS